ncbi:MAG: hypothetical protein L0170_09825, partial [Acidobacteria bacterium]|nr:hypothetical protein [Acidobacteriota bacterium]
PPGAGRFVGIPPSSSCAAAPLFGVCLCLPVSSPISLPFSLTSWTRGKNSEDTFEGLMLMMILSFMRVVAYHAQVDLDALWEKFRLRRLTLRQLAEEWLMSLYEALPLWQDAG